MTWPARSGLARAWRGTPGHGHDLPGLGAPWHGSVWQATTREVLRVTAEGAYGLSARREIQVRRRATETAERVGQLRDRRPRRPRLLLPEQRRPRRCRRPVQTQLG